MCKPFKRGPAAAQPSAIRILLRAGHAACRGLSLDEPVEGHLVTLPVQFGRGRAGLRRPVPVHAQPSNANSVTAAADRINDFLNEASQRFAIPPSWIRAVMRVESLGDPLALSPKGAMGVMQIMPDTWSELRSRYGLGADPYDPRDNIVAGAAYL